VRKAIVELATMDETTAEEMRYALPRGKNKDGTAKVISGPSIRFAEMRPQYGNCQVGAEITEINKKDKYVEAEGVHRLADQRASDRARAPPDRGQAATPTTTT
jgi:hypothetical protein